VQKNVTFGSREERNPRGMWLKDRFQYIDLAFAIQLGFIDRVRRPVLAGKSIRVLPIGFFSV